MATYNMWSDVSAISNSILEDALFVIRETAQMQGLVRVFTDARGGNPRKGFQYNQSTAGTLAESDDLSSSAFTPAALETLTPIEIGEQFFVSDLRAESDVPENIITDGGRELGLAVSDYVETALVGHFSSLTGGTIGWNSGSASKVPITWSFLAAAIARARYANKSTNVPLNAVLHGYQWAVLAKSASVAGATVAVAPGVQDQITRGGYLGQFMGVNLYQSYNATAGTAVYGAVFPRDAIAIDWRRQARVEGQRDASRRGTEFNISAVFAHGVWRPALGIAMCFDASAPTGA